MACDAGAATKIKDAAYMTAAAPVAFEPYADEAIDGGVMLDAAVPHALAYVLDGAAGEAALGR